ncbi:hypothetical protein ACKWTF_001712 [Chironomus riparius]
MQRTTIIIFQDSGHFSKERRQENKSLQKIFECKENHPFYSCLDLYIAAINAKRLEIVNRLHVCIRCLCSNKHKVEECHNKCTKCFISGCTDKNKHALMHVHKNDQISSFTSFNANINVRSQRVTSHFAMVPGDVIASN